MNIDHLPIIQAVEDAAGCPLADLPDDSEWWAVYGELINELNEQTMSKEYDKLVGRYYGENHYCDICGESLVTSMERERCRCSRCVEKEEEKRYLKHQQK